jgi:uncharacterized protein YndB with AHSA1/START domain
MREAGVKFYESEATIAAPPAAVWQVLADTAAWPRWNSGVTAVEGTAAHGAKLTVRSAASPDRAFPVKVTEYLPDRRMVFTGGMPLGLFTGVREYTLEPRGESTLFRMREEYTGPLLGMIWRSMPDLGPSFRQFAAGLKQRVESGG